MPRADVTITTRDGVCPASVFTPSAGSGPWPAVIFYMDAPAIRPTLWEMAQKLADGGYLVLLPDLFYREGPYEPMKPSEIFADPAKRENMMKWVGSLDRDKKISDSGAFIDYLGTRTDVVGTRYGVTGYCMGGNWALTAAGAYPDRFAAILSFHGGNLATDKPDSPHLFVGGVKGEVYVAGAIEDGSFPDEQKARLEEELTVAGIDHEVVTYEGAHHGFAVPDIPSYNEAAAERHWAATFEVLRDRLTVAS
jgi:carboxymethylenebutenolidase